ncbi:MAG: VWA domain-containing protein [Acidobacteria bacterium]|nr:VWA domain-containing protein [Acidobacteriota bacterium]
MRVVTSNICTASNSPYLPGCKRSLRVIIWLLFYVVAFSQSASSQTPPPKDTSQKQDAATIRITTELLQLEVIVTDKKGQPVRNLKQMDFELKEDGKLQEVTYFSVGTSTQPARWITAEAKGNQSITTSPKIRATGRYIVLLADDFHLAPDSLMRTRQALVKFIDQQFSYIDKIALITTSGQLWTYQQFTNKREILKRAINRLAMTERRASSIAGDIPRMTSYQAELIQNRDRDALALAVNEIVRKLPDITPDMAASMALGKAQQMVEETSFHTRATLSTLEDVIRSVRALPGHKSVVFLSDGFTLGGSQQGNFYDLRQITDAAARSGIMIYSLDTRGLTTNAMDVSQPGFGQEQPPGVRMRIEADALEVRKDALNALARDTGGFPVFNTNDLYLGLQKIVADSETYYLLAFEPQETSRDGRFRKLEVRVKDHPEYVIRTSKGFFAPGDKSGNNSKKESGLKTALTRNTFASLVPPRDIPMEMAVDFVDSGKSDGFAIITAHLDLSGLKFEKLNDRFNATLNVMGSVFDEEGKAMDRFNRKLALTLKPATYERILKSGFVFDCLVKLKPGFYQVRMSAVQENSSQTGNVSEWVEIGDLSKKELVLSSIFLASEHEKLYTGPLQNEPSAAEPTDDQQATPMPSQISRRFQRGSHFDYTFFAYNAKSDANGETDLVVQTQLYSGTKVILASPLAPLKLSAEKKELSFVPHVARLTLDDFEPGNYELRLLVIDRVAKASATRSLYFVVEP